MRVVYRGRNQKLHEAVAFVIDLLEQEEFYEAIAKKGSFDFTNKRPSEIAEYIKNKKQETVVRLYTPRWVRRVRHRNTNAYVDPNYPNTLFYNSRKLWRSVGSMVNTVVHEYVHSVDYSADGNPALEYGHGDQSSDGKKDAAPYWIGDLAQRFFDEQSIESPSIDSVAIDPAGLTEADHSEVSIGFSGEPLTRWNGNRNMLLQEELTYVDPAGKKWIAAKGSCLNGATIPRALWSALGAPYSGRYRRASVIHDVAVGELCNADVSPAERARADRMFYHACRADGCSRRFASILYIGVRFGSWMSSIRSNEKSNFDFDPEFIRPSLGGEDDESKFWEIVDGAEEAISAGDLDLIDQLLDNALAR